MLSKQCYNARFIVSSKTMLSGRQMDHQGQGDDARSHVPRVFPRDMLVVVAERERESQLKCTEAGQKAETKQKKQQSFKSYKTLLWI